MPSTSIPTELLIAIIPIALLELALTIYALIDWIKQGSKLENRYLWLILILFINLIGPIVYFWKAPRESSDQYSNYFKLTLDYKKNKNF